MKDVFKDLTALVTGGSSGMGLEFARQLVKSGCQVVIVSNREEELREAVRSLNALPDEGKASSGAADDNGGIASGSLAEGLYMDLAQEDCARRLLEWCEGKGLQIDILINNAGMFFMQYLNEATLPRARAMIKLHVQTVTELCILFGSRMKERGKGYIINMSSMTASIPAPGIAIYSASKAYLKSFGKGFGYEIRPFGVKVTTVCPAAVDTGLYNLGDKTRKAGRSLGLIQTPEALVRRSLKAVVKGRRTISPGLMNAILPPLIALLPNRLIDSLGLKWMPH